MGFAEGFAAGIAVGKKKWRGGGSGDDDEPSYLDDPDYALYQSLPRPTKNQMIFLFRAYRDNVTAGMFFRLNQYSGVSKPGIIFNMIIDWGDGTTTGTLDPSANHWEMIQTKDDGAKHTYEKAGDYVVTVTNYSTKSTPMIVSYREYWVAFGSDVHACKESGGVISSGRTIATKVGEEITANFSGSLFKSKYLEFFDDRIFQDDYDFDGLINLVRVDFQGETKPKILSNGKFSDFYNLDFSNIVPMFSEVEEISGKSLQYLFVPRCALSLPKCKKISEESVYSAQFKRIDLPVCEEILDRSVSGNNFVDEIELPMCEKILGYGLSNLTSLKSASLPRCKDLQGFSSTPKLVEANLPECVSINNSLSYCFRLERVSAPKCTSVINSFVNCFSLSDVTFAENCEFDNLSFAQNTLLDPRPNLDEIIDAENQ